jgi:hypothetical protein
VRYANIYAICAQYRFAVLTRLRGSDSFVKKYIVKESVIARLMLCLLALGLVLPACTKQGPTGATGATGPAGPSGPTGATGAKGNANVVYSAWDSSFSGTSAVWQVPALTTGVLDSAAVMVYVRQNGYVYPVPYDNVNGSGFYINDLLWPGQISLFCSSAYNLNEFAFRYVIIPPGVAGQSEAPSYEELVSQYHLTP